VISSVTYSSKLLYTLVDKTKLIEIFYSIVGN